MKITIGNRRHAFQCLAVFLLALLILAPQSMAAPAQPSVELTHSGEGDQVLLACTGKVSPPDGDSDYQVAMTLSIQAASGITIDPGSVQAIYQAEDGETTVLDGDNWTADQNSGLLVAALEVDTDMGGQLQCRVSGKISSDVQGDLSNTARLDVEYRDQSSGGVTSLSASGKDEIKKAVTPEPTPSAYSLTLDLAGGSLSGKSKAIVWSDDLSEGQRVNLSDLPNPSRNGYFFGGWKLASGTGAKLDSGALVVGKGDVVLRAAWTSKADKLTLDLNGGSGKQVTVDGYTGEDVTVPMPADVLYSRDGYKLAGWSTTPDGQGGKTYTGGESYTLTKEDDVLYAWWAPQYTLTYDANGGTGQMPRRIFSASDPAVISENAFVRTGYDFTGWCISADGRGTLYKSGDTLTLTENTTLYAQWEKIYEAPAEEADNNSHMPLLLGILAALIVVGGVCGFLAWKRRRDDEGPYDDDYDDREPDDFDDREEEYDRRGYRDEDRRDRQNDSRYDARYDDRRDGGSYDRYDGRRERTDRGNSDRYDRYDERRERPDRRNSDRYNERRRKTDQWDDDGTEERFDDWLD